MANAYQPGAGVPQWRDVNCQGNESSVLDCTFSTSMGYGDLAVNIACGKASAPPHFSGAVRLVNGSSASSGRVEMLRDGQWVPMSRNVAPTTYTRLAGSGRSAEGRLDVYRGGKWGLWAAVASSTNLSALAQVACRQLGYPQAAYMMANAYQPGAGVPQWRDVNCQGNESSVLDCTFSTSMGYGDLAVNIACGKASAPPHFSGAVRLVNGSSASSGRVEMLRDGQWVPMSRNVAPTTYTRLAGSGRSAEGRLDVYRGGKWGLWAAVASSTNLSALAQVACRQLGYPQAAYMMANAYQPGAGVPQWRDVNCQGNESSVLDCTFSTSMGYGDLAVNIACGKASAPPHFSGAVRLVNGSSASSGRVEMLRDGQWVPMSRNVAPTTYTRLAGSGRSAEGRLDVYRGGKWGLWAAVASSTNLSALAQVACRQLGYPQAAYMMANAYQPGAGVPQWRDVNCQGNESSVLDCTFSTSMGYGDLAVNIACGKASAPPHFSGAVRLVNGSSASSGRVEMLRDGQWVPMSRNVAPTTYTRLAGSGRSAEGRLDVYRGGKWGLWAAVASSTNLSALAQVACRQLGYPQAAYMMANAYQPGAGVPQWRDVNCQGNESSVLDCTFSTSMGYGDLAVNIACGKASAPPHFSGAVRLVNGSSASSGRVEMLRDGQWVPMSRNVAPTTYTRLAGSGRSAEGRLDVYRGGKWGLWAAVASSTNLSALAQVACRQLGYPQAAYMMANAYQPGAGVPQWRDVNCQGNESSVLDCTFSTSMGYGDLAVNIACGKASAPPHFSGAVRLVNGSSASSGRVEMLRDGQWVPMSRNGNGPHAIVGVGGAYNMQLLCKSACGACTNSVAGTRLVFTPDGKPYYESPCATSASPGRLAQCELFYYTGRKAASDCGEGVCYVEIDRGGRRLWVPDAGCGVVASSIGYPGNVNCPMPSCSCQGTPLASDDTGLRQVIWSSLPTYATTCRSSAVLATSSKCQRVTYTGVKSPSSCGETWCYAQADGTTDYELSSAAANKPNAAAGLSNNAAKSVVGAIGASATRALKSMGAAGETFDECTHCPKPGGFAFHRRKDYYSSNIHDLFRCEKCSVDELSSLCLRIPQCGAFNTNGYLKIVPNDLKPADIVNWPSDDLDPCAGSYLRTYFPADEHWALRIADAEFVVRGPTLVEVKGLLEVYWNTFALGFGTVASWDSICFAVMDRRKAGLACTQLVFGSDYSDGSYYWTATRHAGQEARFEGLTCPTTATKLKECETDDCYFGNCCDPGQDTLLSCSIGLPEAGWLQIYTCQV
ncbi:deleted in malignant brain tumors 1 -like [Chlorella sorokiniana]|uniref:Deleted in malignant brain tumors 1-like n=1 Tax=Chlorella sorokiniana TaxID=3076 RepID=A0A2P6TDF5_CHLSO|nr:deleted in malignant brain tumors 1 -like [Chlorella sorokiniana]|eukprot:PRW20671.1 deleted in malignant brain tumors 1 -like [Chlorella sorokiniana]